jgi:TrmH family RNA methyltransferase
MTETITSTHNPRIRELRKLRDRRRRDETGTFMAEGEDMLEAALRAGAVPRTVFAVTDPPPELQELLSQLPGSTERVTASADALAAAGSLGSGSRVIGVWEQGWSSLPEPPRRPGDEGPSLFLHDVADPGNVGTVLRSAQAFGAGAVLLSARTADPFGPKAVRASMGAVFGRPPMRADLAAAAAGRRSIALVPGQGRPLREVPLEGPVLFALGAERAGLPPDVVAACDEIAHVPVDRGAADSLNVAMAATLCLYEYRARHG